MSSISRSGNAPRPIIPAPVQQPLNRASTPSTTAGTQAANGAKSPSQVSSFTKAANVAKLVSKPAGSDMAPHALSVSPAAAKAASAWHAGAVTTATEKAQALGSGGAGAKLGAVAGLGAGVYGIGSYGTGLVKAIKNGEGGHAVADNALRLTKSTVSTTKAALDTAAAFSSAKDFSKLSTAANDALTAVSGKTGKVSSAIADAAATAVHNGKALSNVDVMASIAKTKGLGSTISVGVQTAASNGLRGVGLTKAANAIDGNIVKAGEAVVDAATAGKTAGKVVSASKTAATAANIATDGAKAALKGGAIGAGTAAKTAGRFAPGANVAIAALDIGIAANTLADPNASIAAKVTTSITAGGSVLAATNIPIVSQLGAAISLGSTAVGAIIENADVIKEGFQKAGSAIKDGFQAVGSAFKEGAKKVFSGW